MSEQKMLKKMSIPTMGIKPKQEVKDLKEGESKELVTIYGIVSKAKPITTTFGDSIAFSGEFVGINLITNEKYTSGRLFLPADIEEAVDSQLILANGPVEFAYKINMVEDERSSTGYVYVSEPLLKATESNQMANLEKSIKDSLKKKSLVKK